MSEICGSRVLLTIAIPTFNRNRLLLELIDQLAEELESVQNVERMVNVLVVDNHSPEPVSVPGQLAGAQVTLIRNRANVGGNANIARCLEWATGEWVWIIGDDDKVVSGAVNSALESVRRNETAAFVHHSTQGIYAYQRRSEVAQVSGFWRTTSSFDNALFVSSTLFKIDACSAGLSMANHYGYSCAPHLVWAMYALSQPGAIAVIEPQALAAHTRPEEENRGWIVPIAFGLPVLLELGFLTRNDRKWLARHLVKFPRVGSIVHQSLLRVKYQSKSRFAEARFVCIASSRLPGLRGLIRRWVGFAGALSALCPEVTFPVVALFYRMRVGVKSGASRVPLDRL